MSIWFGFTTAMKGAPYTIGVSFFAVIIGLIIGFVLAMMRMSKIWPFRIISGVYIDIIRGTPMVVQALIFAYGVPQLLQKSGVPFRWPELLIPCMLVCGMNSAAYMAEIIRGGLQAVEKGQMEAARSLGLSYGKSMRKIVLPQAIRTMIPSIINQFIITLKDTSILSVIGLPELVKQGQIIISRTFESFNTWAIIAVMYLIVITILSIVAKKVERRISYAK